jgi:hypothetical protein
MNIPYLVDAKEKLLIMGYLLEWAMITGKYRILGEGNGVKEGILE